MVLKPLLAQIPPRPEPEDARRPKRRAAKKGPAK
jgi:hypothetical protein